MNQYIVIDANVARSCTEPARHETSEACLRLTHILQDKGCAVGVALTPDLVAEWRKHASPVFLRWWANMESRKRVRMEEDKRLSDYRNYLESVDDEGIRIALMKDAHIVELSLAKHYPIASQDEKQRRYVSELSATYPLIEKIQWFNPVLSMGWQEWVKSGCEDTHLYRCKSEKV